MAWFFKEHRKSYGIALGLLIFLNFVEVAPPAIIGRVIDSLNQGTLSVASLLRNIVIFAILVAISYGFGYVWQARLFGGSNELQRMLRTRLVHQFLLMTPPFFEKNRIGDLMARATNDLNAVSETAGFGILTLIDSTTFSATILVTMAVLVSWKLTLAALLPMPLIAFVMTKYGKVVHERFVLAQNAFGQMNDKVLEAIAGIRVLRAYVQEEAEERRFAATTEDVFQKNLAVAKVDSLFEPTIKILVGLMYLIGLGYGAYLLFQSQVTIGGLTAFNVYLGMLIWPMLAFGQLINIMQRGNASLDRVNETLAYVPDVPNPEKVVAIAVPEIITFQHLTFRYPLSAVDNLKDLSLVIRRGQTLGIVGRTGSGKSTLIKQLLREYPPAKSGALTVNGVPIEEIAFATLHGWFGYVPQESLLFSRTVKQNVRFGAADATPEEVWRALELADFTKDLSAMPAGLDTLVGEKGIALSGGQQQRLALARAVILNPEILLLDDAMSAVDAKTETHIVNAIRADRRGRTTLIVTHRLLAIRHADWIIVLDNGQIVEEGTHETLLQLGGWYQEQYLRQQLDDSIELEAQK